MMKTALDLCVKAEVFKTIDDFLKRDTIERDGRNQMFVLADAGMGKTSLFMMLKLTQLSWVFPFKVKVTKKNLDKPCSNER